MRRFRITAVLLSLCFVAQAFAASLVVDGNVRGYSEYDHGYNVEYALDDGSMTANGQLWTGQDDDYYYVGFVEPLGLVDNSYDGGGHTNKVDWGPNHDFHDLISSDKAGFTFTNQWGKPLLNIYVDYLTGIEYSGGGHNHGETPYFSGGVEYGDGELEYIKKHWLAPDITAATSLQYNYEQFKDTDLFVGDKDYSKYYSPKTKWDGSAIDYSDQAAIDAAYGIDQAYVPANEDYSGWIFEVAYEVKINKALLGNFYDYEGTSGIDALIAHVSPYKQNFQMTDTPLELIPPIVPEPATALLLTLGAVMVKRRKRKA